MALSSFSDAYNDGISTFDTDELLSGVREGDGCLSRARRAGHGDPFKLAYRCLLLLEAAVSFQWLSIVSAHQIHCNPTSIWTEPLDCDVYEAAQALELLGVAMLLLAAFFIVNALFVLIVNYCGVVPASASGRRRPGAKNHFTLCRAVVDSLLAAFLPILAIIPALVSAASFRDLESSSVRLSAAALVSVGSMLTLMIMSLAIARAVWSCARTRD
mmetsp:Transcript_9313/g.29636  ORF Transcript_9313/g.29636 Transcript_9313/m.29636 type:complete len:215 (-) Transcript_9313:648-1292(-)